MVKLNISIEGENLSDILNELMKIGISIVKSNKKEIKEIMEFFVDESIDVLMKNKTIENGAKLYRKINNEINYQYKQKR